jgi:hypothetical protein
VAALSVERYVDARSKLTAKCRLYITLTSLGLIWILGLLLPYPFIFYTFLYDSSIRIISNSSPEMNSTITSPSIHLLTCRSFLSEQTLAIYEILLYIIAFLIPYAIIVLFSLKLLIFLRNWLTRKERLTRIRVTKRRTRGVKLVLCIVLSFLLCYTPFWTFKFYTSFLLDETIRERPVLRRFLTYAHQSVVLLSHIEGILNPLFFIVLTEHFSLTFSKHRDKHWSFLRMNTDGKRSSINPSLTSLRKQRRTATTTTTTTTDKIDTNGLLQTHQQSSDDNQRIPAIVIVSS